MRIHAVNPTTIHHQIAQARLHLQRAQYECKVTKADAEAQIIARLNGSYGKNAEERERQLTLGLSEHNGYIRSLAHVEEAESALAMLEADLEAYKDARRVEEWSIREQLARAIAGKTPTAEEGDHAIDAAADEEGWSDLLSDYQRQRAIGAERAKIYADIAELSPH
jgi:hypothetical protein